MCVDKFRILYELDTFFCVCISAQYVLRGCLSMCFMIQEDLKKNACF